MPPRPPRPVPTRARVLPSTPTAPEGAPLGVGELADIYNLVTAGVLVHDQSGAVIYANPAALGLLGVSARQLLGRTPLGTDWRVQREDGTDLPESEQPALVALRTGRPVRDAVLSVVHPDGRRVWLCVDAAPTAEGDRVVSTLHDQTALKESERQTKALVQMENLRTLGSMASGIAHDLRQYLSLIAGHGELALISLDGGSPQDREATRASIAIVMQAALDGADALKRLQSFARQRDDEQVDSFPLGELLREVAKLTAPKWRDAPQAGGRTIRLHVEEAGDTTIAGQPGALREVFTNLIFNAVDAMPQGGTILLAARRRGGRVEADVTDGGVGMSPSVKERVLEPFFTTKGEGGTGLGLAIVAETVATHGGGMAIESALGLGTTVHLWFPASAPESELVLPAVAIEPDAGAPPTIEATRVRVLSVDDEPELAEMVSYALKPEGCDVTAVTSGEAALALLESERFDAVVSDLSLGGAIDGWRLADEVRERWPSTRFVLLTGWGPSIDAEQMQKLGVQGVLSKPYRFADLRRIVRALVRSG